MCLISKSFSFTILDDNEGFIASPEPEQGMQDKIVAAWDTLQVSRVLLLLLVPFLGHYCCKHVQQSCFYLK
jgi:hypothetical protein